MILKRMKRKISNLRTHRYKFLFLNPSVQFGTIWASSKLDERKRNAFHQTLAISVSEKGFVRVESWNIQFQARPIWLLAAWKSEETQKIMSKVGANFKNHMCCA